MIAVHENAGLFREALRITQTETGFVARLIEKDYFCSLLLEFLAAAEGLVFKGGTCLAKVYADFYRLSEDLDFVIPTPEEASRSERSRWTVGLKAAIPTLPRQCPVFRLLQPLTGFNNSTQHIAVVGYTSFLGEQQETIKIEVGLREPLLTPAREGTARTLLLDPVSGKPLVKPVPVRCVSQEEAFAEKFRAALSRREAAIRDFYDIDHAVRRLGLRPGKPEFVGWVRRKLAIPGNAPVDVSPARLAALRPQLESQLKAVLRARDFSEFDLDRAFATVAEVAAALDRTP